MKILLSAFFGLKNPKVAHEGGPARVKILTVS